MQGVDELISLKNIKAPDFIKFDLESAEEFALHNGNDLFSRRRPVLLLELHGEKVLRPVADFFKKFSYVGWNILQFTDSSDLPLISEADLHERVTSNTIVCLPEERQR